MNIETEYEGGVLAGTSITKYRQLGGFLTVLETESPRLG